MIVKILNRWTENVLFEGEFETIRDAVLAAHAAKANLYGADLRGANLRDADLRDANLRDANLYGADLEPIQADFNRIIIKAIPEIAGLRRALIEGRVDGSTYTGACACLVGTIANERQADCNTLDGITPDSGRPAERFFLAIRKGDKPETNQASAIAVSWIDEFVADLRAAHLAVPGFDNAGTL
ncbi:MAG: pentapeptide repeat-containing protein [Pleurocapsa sp. SU_196_0]|nr:pentapeptide repeat-containing protein [Pleurocapsa sp. SU_196_0]